MQMSKNVLVWNVFDTKEQIQILCSWDYLKQSPKNLAGVLALLTLKFMTIQNGFLIVMVGHILWQFEISSRTNKFWGVKWTHFSKLSTFGVTLYFRPLCYKSDFALISCILSKEYLHVRFCRLESFMLFGLWYILIGPDWKGLIVNILTIVM